MKIYKECHYNAGIICSVGQERCLRCGWNPKVEERRKERIRYYLLNPQLRSYGTFSPGGIQTYKVKARRIWEL